MIRALLVIAAIPLILVFYIVFFPVAVYQVGRAVIKSLKDSYVQ